MFGLLVLSGYASLLAKRWSLVGPGRGLMRASARAQGAKLVRYCCPDESRKEGNA